MTVVVLVVTAAAGAVMALHHLFTFAAAVPSRGATPSPVVPVGPVPPGERTVTTAAPGDGNP